MSNVLKNNIKKSESLPFERRAFYFYGRNLLTASISSWSLRNKNLKILTESKEEEIWDFSKGSQSFGDIDDQLLKLLGD
jgi:hypothetical protein